MTAYVDGRPMANWTLTKAPALKIGEATIGNWVPRDYDVSRPLSGSMDEFVIFTWCFSDAEIKQLHQGGGGTP